MQLDRPYGQMSDSFLMSAFIILSGGLQDAYTYCCRDKVFANAQTGNIVLMSTHLFAGDWAGVFRYFVPVISFMAGIFVAECVHRRYKCMEKVHWRQLIILAEIVLLFFVGFLPQEVNTFANALVSFVCAMQVQTFRKVRGHAYASTMCIGNLRSGTASNVTKLAPSEKVKIGTRTAHSATEQRLCAVFLKKGMTRKRIEKSAKKSYSKRINYATL